MRGARIDASRRLFARAAGRSRARGAPAQLLRARALQPRSRRDHADRQHGRRFAVAAVLQRSLAGRAHASRRTRACWFTRSAICCATTRVARRPQASGTTGAGTRPATAKSTTIFRRKDCRCRAIRRCPPGMDCENGSSAEIVLPASCRRRRAAERPRSPMRRSRQDCGSGAHGERRFWELPADDGVRAASRVSTGSRPSSCGATWRSASKRPRSTTARRPARLAALGPRDARAEGRLHGDHPPRRAPSLARQHARPIRPHLPAAASPAGLLRRVHHAQFPSAAAAAGVPDRHVRLDGRLAAGESRLRAGGPDAPARIRRGSDRRVLRRRRARCAEGLSRQRRSSCTAAAAPTWASGCARSSRGRNAPDRPAGHRQRLPHAVAGRTRRRFR